MCVCVCGIMGKSYSHMNVWALSCIIRADSDIITTIYDVYEANHVNIHLAPFEITEEVFHDILVQLNVHASDVDIFEDIFRLLDVRSRGISNIRDVCISLAPLLAKNLTHMYTICFEILDRQKVNLVTKEDVVLVMKLMNNTCSNVGDKPLAPEILSDYVDSVYTAAGRIDGEIYYPDYVETLSMHPIIQLLLSPQFQGTLTSKLMTDEEIDLQYKVTED